MSKPLFPKTLLDGLMPIDYEIPGLHVHISPTRGGTVYFVSADKEIYFPEHAHGYQWSVVVAGSCRLTMNGRTYTYRKGDTYAIPAGMPHQLTLGAGYAEGDYTFDAE